MFPMKLSLFVIDDTLFCLVSLSLDTPVLYTLWPQSVACAGERNQKVGLPSDVAWTSIMRSWRHLRHASPPSECWYGAGM